MNRNSLFLILSLVVTIGYSQEKVGINQETPEHTLDVRSPAISQAAEFNLSSFDKSKFIRFYSGSDELLNPSISWAPQRDMIFGTFEDSPLTFTEFMRINKIGFLGLGTSNPQEELHIQDNDGQVVLTLESGPGKDVVLQFTDSYTLPLRVGNDWGIRRKGLEKGMMQWWHDGKHRMSLDTTGNLGVKVRNPQASLDVMGGNWNLEGGSPGDLRIGNNTNNFRIGVALGGGGAGATRMFTQGNGGILLGTNNTIQLEINSDGSIKFPGFAGTGDQNLILDSTGKMKIGNLGIGDSDWTETTENITTSKPALFKSTQIIPGDPFPINLDYVTTITGVGINQTSGPGLNLQNESSGNISMVMGGGKVSIAGNNNLSSAKLQVFGNSNQENGQETTVEIGNNNNDVRLNIDSRGMDGFLTRNDIDYEASNISFQRRSSGDVRFVTGGGKVIVGPSATEDVRLHILGPDNNGTMGGLMVESHPNGQKLLFDGNEIDALTTAMHLNANSNFPVTIGTYDVKPGYLLNVDGKIVSEEVLVQYSEAWPDYVFQEDFNLLSFKELEKHINENGHLPGIPKAEIIESEGIEIADMQKRMMEKVEELTLYILELNNRIEVLEKENKLLKNK